MWFSAKKIILVSDNANNDEVVASSENYSLDRTTSQHTTALADALRSHVSEVLVCSEIREFVELAGTASNTLVFPNWSGKRSRNRTSLVAAICEASGLPYLGADAYLRTVFFDKSIGKSLCRDFGLSVAIGELLRNENDIACRPLPEPPLVCKPVMEGSSIGIDNLSLVDTDCAARERASVLLARFGQPVLVEEFVAGREVSICMRGTPEGSTPVTYVGEWIVPDNPTFFATGLATAEVKSGLVAPEHLRDITNTFPPSPLKRAQAMFVALGKVDFMRVDGRLAADGSFVVIEVTVDINFSPWGEFAGLPMLSGASYEEVVGQWLNLAQLYLQINATRRA